MKSTGKRKSAIANVTMVLNKTDNGNCLINNKTPEVYFQNQSSLISQIYLPIKTIQCEKKFDLSIDVKGSGLSSQAGAIQLAIAKILNEHILNTNNLAFSRSEFNTEQVKDGTVDSTALLSKNETSVPSRQLSSLNQNTNLITKTNKKKYRLIFKKENYLTSDPRQKERRKPGLKKARKSSQFSKR